MYHDQGLAPFKALTAEGGVNYTAGLTIVRTSPSHGTAYSITGKNEASPDSFRSAIYLACDIYRKRKQYKEVSANPLHSPDLSEI
jgi:4-hydroxythreonine-4-phosphate dehydrogenase